ncbi:hypothetical protein BC835DRAFT_1492179 [Cytidiella melzeri]|nr:hypothetical protein BC835DRAFT_1492179 [Cytidiella melzeri]
MEVRGGRKTEGAMSSCTTKRNSVLTGKNLRPLLNKTRVFACHYQKRTTTHLLVALADIAMNPFPETQGIEEEVKHNKVDGDGEEGNKESEEVEEIGAPRDQDRDKGVASVEGKLDDIYIYQTNRKVFFLNPKTLAHAVHANRTLQQYNSRTTQSCSLPRQDRIGFHQIEQSWLAEQANGKKIAANLLFEQLRGNTNHKVQKSIELRSHNVGGLCWAYLTTASKEIGQQSALSRLVLLASSGKKACAQSYDLKTANPYKLTGCRSRSNYEVTTWEHRVSCVIGDILGASEEAEDWFQKQLKDIVEGTATPVSNCEWKSRLRQTKSAANTFLTNIETFSADAVFRDN